VPSPQVAKAPMFVILTVSSRFYTFDVLDSQKIKTVKRKLSIKCAVLKVVMSRSWVRILAMAGSHTNFYTLAMLLLVT
jgi:hypothetical protein